MGTGTSATPFALPPTLTGMNPVSGPAGTLVTLTGTNFVGTQVDVRTLLESLRPPIEHCALHTKRPAYC